MNASQRETLALLHARNVFGATFYRLNTIIVWRLGDREGYIDGETVRERLADSQWATLEPRASPAEAFLPPRGADTRTDLRSAAQIAWANATAPNWALV